MYRPLKNWRSWMAGCAIAMWQLSAAVCQASAGPGQLAVSHDRPTAPGPLPAHAQPCTLILSHDDYRDRVQAIWTAQMLGAMMGWPFEHKVASVEWIHTLNPKVNHAPVDDDWYYEMVAIRAFEKFGIDMSVQQLGQQWLDNSAGTWGSSEQARLLMNKGIQPPDCGHPRYNKLWFSIGSQFSADVYGALAPAMPNLAGELARKYGHINGYAEGADGGVFIAGLISLGFVEKDPKTIVRKAACLIDPASPYRKCLDQVIQMAGEGKTAADIFDEVERRWHIEYPATNNAVANGGIVAASVWFGKGDFLKTVNLAYTAADFTDADCNAANAGAVVAAMHGMKGLPAELVSKLGDSIIGDKLGKVALTPPVHETISGLATRTAAIGEKILQHNGAALSNGKITIVGKAVVTQPAELFSLSDLMAYWAPDWKLKGAGFGGAQGGMPGIRGITWLDNDVLATYPRDEVKGVAISRTITLDHQKELAFDAGVDSHRVWRCMVLVNNKVMVDRLMEGTDEARTWRPVKVDLSTFQGGPVTIRIYQRVLVPGRVSGNAYWKNLRIQPAGATHSDPIDAAGSQKPPSSASSQRPQPPVDSLLSPGDVAVKGLLGQAIDLSEHGRLRTLPDWNNGELITMFSTEARNKNNTTDWYGEHAGKWLYSAALAVSRTGNDTLKKLLFRTADYLVHNQEADGYLGSYSPELRFTNPQSKQHKKSWDVWSQSYMILGLLEVNRYYPNERYFNAAKKIGELLLKTFGDGSADLTNYGTRYGYSATVALEPVVELYKATSDQRYLDFAQLIVKEIEQREGLRFIAAALNNRDMETVADGKAYQIIWNIVGLAKLYEVTGTPDYLKAVEKAWQNIHDYHLTITGGPWGGIGKHKECFNTKGFWDPYGFIETCSIMSWIQLNQQLLHLTGEAKYAQEIEKSAYNALLGAQFSNGEDWTYHSFTNGRRHPANYNDCCPSSGVLALEELSPLIYTRKQDGIACNLYTENEATVSLNSSTRVHISQQTTYPFSGKIKLTLTPSKKARFPLFIRIPDWAVNVEIKVDGKAVSAEEIRSGTYYSLTRDWEKSTLVEIDFPTSLRRVQQSEFAVMPQGKDDLYRVNWFALAQGPLVYASNGLIDGKDREMNFHLPSEKAENLFEPVAATGKWDGQGYRFKAPGVQPLLFLPFYEAGGREAGSWRLTWMQSGIN